jgi:hypothetical protein
MMRNKTMIYAREFQKQLVERETEALRYWKKSHEIWHDLDANARHGVRFGLFPQGVMQVAEAEGFDGVRLAVALMERAKADGGMRA